ncbi:MAG: hypothetical protein ACOYMF_07295 [Bacteroidales bacterium]
MFKKLFFMLIAACVVVFGGCHLAKKSQQMATKTQKVTGPRIIIYKTKADYFLNVPVGLSADRKTITSYPAITDVYTGGKLAIPTKLEGGFLLDNRGISAEVAFINLSYEQYAALKSTPAVIELQELIIDADPLTIMYDCGSRNSFQDIVGDINNLILKKDFSKFKKLK